MRDLIVYLAMESNVKLVRWGNTYLVRLDDARHIIEICKRHCVFIVGIEGFLVENTSRVPELDWIADYSDLSRLDKEERSRKSAEAACVFLKKLPKRDDILLEFVLDAAEGELAGR